MDKKVSLLIKEGKELLTKKNEQGNIEIIYCSSWIEKSRLYLKNLNQDGDYSLRIFQSCLNKYINMTAYKDYHINKLIGVLEAIEDVGIEISSEYMGSKVILEKMLLNFDKYVTQVKRAQKNRKSERNKIQDEADVQDAIHAILKLLFDDVRNEFYIGENAGSNSRLDFYIKDINVYLEIKYATNNLSDKKLGEEITTDLQRYNDDSNNELIFFIYDKDSNINNPQGFINDIENKNNCKVIISPK